MLRDDEPYRDLGAQHFDQIDRSRTILRLMRRLRDLGANVALATSTGAATTTEVSF